MTLPLRDAAGAAHAARAVSDSSSASYRHYLTPTQFADRFGPTTASVGAVTSWLHGAGLHATRPSSTSSYLRVSGSAARVNAAFGTTLTHYRNGKRSFTAPSSALSVPAAVSGKVQGVLGLDRSHPLHADHILTPKPVRMNDKGVGDGCSTYYGQYTIPDLDKAPAPFNRRLPGLTCGYTPAQMARARHNPSSLTGKNVKVGITLWCNDPRIEADTNRWAKSVGAPALRAGQYTVLTPADGYDPVYCDDQGSGGINEEQALDVQSIHGAASAASITYSAANSPFDAPLIDALHALVDSNRVDIITDSWGGSEGDDTATNAAFEAVFTQAAAQGISVLFSSGDYGDNSNGDAPKYGTGVDYPASDPMVTSVGGTSLGLTNASGSQVGFEQAWNNTISLEENDTWTPWQYRFGGGGGTSKVFAQPYYQKGVVPTRFAGTTPHRVYPDLANAADPYTGYKIGYHDPSSQTFTISSIGGTSWASPYTAGTLALAQQSGNGKRIGFLNPAVYGSGHAGLTDIAGNTVTKGEQFYAQLLFGGTEPATVAFNAQPLEDQTLTSERGYDNMTGFGVPTDTGTFIKALTR